MRHKDNGLINHSKINMIFFIKSLANRDARSLNHVKIQNHTTSHKFTFIVKKPKQTIVYFVSYTAFKGFSYLCGVISYHVRAISTSKKN